MTFLWFEPKRVWMNVLAVSSDQPDRYFQSAPVRIDRCEGQLNELFDTLKDYCNPHDFRFMHRISQCPHCNERKVLDSDWDLLPEWWRHLGGWEAKTDLQTLYSKSYPPLVIIDQCAWCADREHIRLTKQAEKQKREMLVQSLRDEFSRMTATEIAGKLCRCTICATLFWSNRLRHHKRNVCSPKCNEVLSSFIERSRSYIRVIDCSDQYIQHLLGGITHPSLIECKRTQIKLTRALKEKRKHDNEN